MSDLTLSLDTSDIHLKPEPLKDYAPRQLLTPLPTPGHFLLVIDNSSLEVFTTCPQSAYYKLILKREAHARNAALTFGGALHEGLEKFLYQQYHQANAPAECSCGFCLDSRIYEEEQDQRILSFFTEHPAPPDEYRTVQNCLAVLAAYRQRAALPDYQWEIQSDADGPIIERAFELPLGVIDVNEWINGSFGVDPSSEEAKVDCLNNVTQVYVRQIHVAWSGRIDAVALCGDPKIVRVIDHKTTSIMGDSFMQDFQISNQVLGYVWASRQLWPGLDISAFCLNAIHFKKPTGTGAITAPGPRGGPAALNFIRGYYEYSPERLEQWSKNCMMIVSDFVHCLTRDYYPLATKWCFGKYGKCQYHDVCVQDNPDVRRNMIMSDMFKGVTWNPVAGR